MRLLREREQACMLCHSAEAGCVRYLHHELDLLFHVVYRHPYSQ
jgi:phosphoribosyl-dephospho-CoA transferase